MSLMLWQRFYRFCLCLLVGVFLSLAIASLPWMQSVTIVVASELTLAGAQVEQQGIERYRLGKYNEAIATWQQALNRAKDSYTKATIYTNLAAAYRQIGQLGKAIASI